MLLINSDQTTIVAKPYKNSATLTWYIQTNLIRLEKLNVRSSRSIAKVLGTIICVLGASSMALFKGPKLLNMEFPIPNSVFSSGGENWVLGCLYLFGSGCCWSFWLILQVL